MNSEPLHVPESTRSRNTRGRRPGWIVRALLMVASALGVMSPAASSEGPAILTFHADPERTGWVQEERTLTPTSLGAGRFGKLWASSVAGAVYAEPLVVSGLAVLGRVRTIAYVVTEWDLIYAFDAADGTRLWGPVSLGAPVRRAASGCGDIDPAGITGTPVLDRGAGTLYAVGLTTPDGGRTETYTITALDVKSGLMRPGWPVSIAPRATPDAVFDAAVEQQRGALLLLGGTVYVPFGGSGRGCGGGRAWVVAVPVASPGTSRAVSAPAQWGTEIPAAGGIAADPSGNLYVAIGAGSSGNRTLGGGVFRLRRGPLEWSGSARGVVAPADTASGLGASAPLVLPDETQLGGPHLLFVSGSHGIGYLINRDALDPGLAGARVSDRCVFALCRDDEIIMDSDAAYWNGRSTGQLLLVAGRGVQPTPCTGVGGVVALRLAPVGQSRVPVLRVAWCGPSMRNPGTPSVTGTGPGGGIVWVVDASPQARLYALDARTGAVAYVEQYAGTVPLGSTPAAVGGRVFLGMENGVVAYGLH